MDAGDALFFHSNVLHQSDANRGPNRRMVFLAAYNRADNSPVFDVTGASCKYTPLIKVDTSYFAHILLWRNPSSYKTRYSTDI